MKLERLADSDDGFRTVASKCCIFLKIFILFKRVRKNCEKPLRHVFPPIRRIFVEFYMSIFRKICHENSRFIKIRQE